MKTAISLLCPFILLGRDAASGCPCSNDCNLPEENSCPEGLNPLCEQNDDACVCDCVSSVMSKTKEKSEEVATWYALSIEIDSAAAGALVETGYDLAIFKGYAAGGTEESFDTAWYVMKNCALVESDINLKWTAFTRAGFVKQVGKNEIILRQDTKISEKFEGGQRVIFDNEGWSGPVQSNTAHPPYFEIEYKPTEHPMNLSLLAPVVGANDEEEWSPFFYDKFEMNQNSVVKGFATKSLYVQLTRDVQAGTYTGSVYKTAKKIHYGDKTAMSICISTTDNQDENLQITLGSCTQLENTRMGMV